MNINFNCVTPKIEISISRNQLLNGFWRNESKQSGEESESKTEEKKKGAQNLTFTENEHCLHLKLDKNPKRRKKASNNNKLNVMGKAESMFRLH